MSEKPFNLLNSIPSSPWIPTKYYRNLQAAKLDQYTQLWAFATTIYEIFSRCKDDLRNLTQDQLIRQRNTDGNILKMPYFKAGFLNFSNIFRSLSALCGNESMLSRFHSHRP